AVNVVRQMTGATNCRAAIPGTIRGDLGMSGQENLIHASDSPESAAVELARFFNPGEIFDYTSCVFPAIYAEDDLAK
ncbi:MAG: nucleoside-diphosphate kinase, partial [Muribaculaceae bacterium]|nr:nucleoside-diphosphate kinase [Muribaculaceae bacterium]